MINLSYSTQDIYKIKEIVTKRRFNVYKDDNSIDIINEHLSKGWVILSICTNSYIEKDKESETELRYDDTHYVLGFPNFGLSPVVDEHWKEFVP